MPHNLTRRTSQTYTSEGVLPSGKFNTVSPLISLGISFGYSRSIQNLPSVYLHPIHVHFSSMQLGEITWVIKAGSPLLRANA